MSDYYLSLDPVAKARYDKKLEVLGLGQQDDPYAVGNAGKFVQELTHWPPIEYGHIFCYFVERPGEFGRMIACDNSSCKYQWFHFECVNIEVEPDGQWYCPDCRP